MKFEVMAYRQYVNIEEEWFEVEAENEEEEAKELVSLNMGKLIEGTVIDCLDSEFIDYDEWTVEEKKGD